ncbi:hypothetical protein CN198_14245 [Sinorhizobium meliloti]|nr:hypothetical protein CN198_14245 [Sinorhizobium meliloti]
MSRMDDDPYDGGACQRCGQPSEIILKIGEHVVRGEARYKPDRRLCLKCCEIERAQLLREIEQ